MHRIPLEARRRAFGIIDLRMLAQQETSAEHITLGIFAARGLLRAASCYFGVVVSG